ncbi:MAG: hypothetical protein AB1611_18060 [bacterium]
MSESTTKNLNSIFQITWILMVCLIAGYLFTLYRPYLAVSEYEQHLHSLLHADLKPSGTVGHALGIIGTILMFLSYILYFLRKRVEKLECLGPLSLWLEVHIFFGILGPVLIFFHSGFATKGLVGVAFWLMVVTVISGIFGRVFFSYCFWGISKIYEPLYAIDHLIERDLREASKISPIIKRIQEVKPPGFPCTCGIIDAIKQWRFIRRETEELLTLINDRYTDAEHEEYKVLRTWGDELIKRIREVRYISVLDVYLSALNKWEIIHKVCSYLLFILATLHIMVTVYWGYRWIF